MDRPRYGELRVNKPVHQKIEIDATFPVAFPPPLVIALVQQIGTIFGDTEGVTIMDLDESSQISVRYEPAGLAKIKWQLALGLEIMNGLDMAADEALRRQVSDFLLECWAKKITMKMERVG